MSKKGRRSFLQSAAGVLGAGFWADQTLEALPQNTNTNSKPSALRITDLRVATVANISLVSVGALIGIAGYGQLFTNGFQLQFVTEIVTGIVATLLLALVADLVLQMIGRLVTPWTRVGR